MGAVYEAIDQRLDTTVALKETLFADERLRKQFEREARLLARLHHPALPRVSDHFAEGDGQFLIMQFIAGDDLAEMIARRGDPFPPQQVLTWADQLLDALDYLHTQDPQIVHRDIKPQNLKLTARGQIILLDFGLAKGQAGEISRISAAASIFGYTPNYAPLEQIQGQGTDPRSDLYALAATVYHLMTGVKPPDALTRAAALVNGQPDPLRPASEENIAVGPAVDEALRKAMAQNRDQRYANAIEMRKALQATDQVATVTNRAEAKTVLFPPSAPTVPPATQQIPRQSTVSTGETTFVRQNAVARKRLLPWGLSAATVLVLACGVWGFYTLRQRNTSALQSLPSNPSPSDSPAVAPTVTTSANISSKPADESKHEVIQTHPPAVQQNPARKNEKAAQTGAKKREPPVVITPAPKPADRAGEGEEGPPSDPREPTIPDINVPNLPRRGRGGTRVMPDGTVIRNFPDGTQVITTPDGTRVLVAPDGRREVLRPGQKRIPGRVRPAP
jgi:serine/threonine protein kinase